MLKLQKYPGHGDVCVLASLFVLILMTGCLKKEEATPKRQSMAAMKTVPVKVATVQQKDMPVQFRNIGTVEAYASVTVKPQVTAELKKVHFQEGLRVKRNDLLFTLDKRQYEVALKQAEANLAKDMVQLQNAKRDANRKADLWQKGAVSLETRDESRASADALEAAVLADKAAVEATHLPLSYCTITSPIPGITGQLLVDPGNLVKANETSLVVLNQIQPIYVGFTAPETEFLSIQKYAATKSLQVDAFIPGQEDHKETGILSFIDNAIDRTTGTILFKATFANKEEKLWPGQFVQVILTMTMQTNAVVVPSQAIQIGQMGPYAFVVKTDQSVELRPVVVSRMVEGETVITSGLQAEECVVTDGHLRLIPGSKVEIITGKRPDA